MSPGAKFVSTWIVASTDGVPLKVKAKFGNVIVGFEYDAALSATSNHKAAALEMAIIAGLTVSEASRLTMVQGSSGFDHVVAATSSEKSRAEIRAVFSSKHGIGFAQNRGAVEGLESEKSTSIEKK